MLGEKPAKQAKRRLGHIRQDQTHQVAAGGAQSRIEVTKLIAYFEAAQGAAAPAAPAGFTLRTGAGAQFVFVVNAICVTLL